MKLCKIIIGLLILIAQFPAQANDLGYLFGQAARTGQPAIGLLDGNLVGVLNLPEVENLYAKVVLEKRINAECARFAISLYVNSVSETENSLATIKLNYCIDGKSPIKN